MESSKVQWLQRMGIDVWRPRTVDRVAQDRTEAESPPRSTDAPIQPSHTKTKHSDNAHSSTETELSSSSRPGDHVKDQTSTLKQHVRIEVSCSLGAGLLLIKDNDALDRDFSEDIFRAYRLSKGEINKESGLSFFRFNWPAETRLKYIKGTDATLDGAKRAFLATTRTLKREFPKLIVAFGQQAVQLSGADTFDSARVLVCLEDPDSITFKNRLWNFLRDEP